MKNNKFSSALISLKRLFAYIFKDYKVLLSFIILAIIISALSQVMGSLFLEKLIDDYITPLLGISNPDFSDLFNALIFMAVIYLVGVLAILFYNRMMVVISQGVQKNIRDDLFSRMQKLPIKYFDTHSHGDIMSHYTNDIDTLRQMLSQSIPQLFSSIISIIFIFSAMLYLNLLLSLIVIVVIFISLQVTKKLTSYSSKYFNAQQEQLGKVNGYIEEMIKGIKVVKVFSYEDESKKVFSELNDDLYSNAYNAHKFANYLMPILHNLGNLQYVLIAIIGSTLVINGVGGLTIGIIASFLQLSRSFSQPISQISTQINSVIMALAGSKRIFDLMDEIKERNEGKIKMVNIKEQDGKLIETPDVTNLWAWKIKENNAFKYQQVKGDIDFKDVDFSYTKNNPILKNINLYAKPGQKVAFVGATGAGKTTITNLINRFYDINKGQILYDGIDITNINKRDLRHSIGIVLQDTALFTGTIKENIRYGKLNASDEEVLEAAKLAYANSFIERLPQGYETIIDGNNDSLSQGQRQLISIARAAIANPPVMILDEATSSIDTHTEAFIQKGMDSLMKGRTVFVIAHRLSTIKNADVIMLLDHGEIIERGNHEQLMAQKGRYYQLYTGAFELE